MGSAKTSLFPLPPSRVIETVYVQLADGRIVARGTDELAAMPSGAAPAIVARSQG
jgi:hypothetical protein